MSTEAPVTWRDFRRIEAMSERHEVELHGERGIYKALEDLTDQLRWVQRALWGLAASIIIAAITFASMSL